jgi:ActR/RegA family two-component response regulator
VFNYHGSKTILCIDDDDGMLCYQKTLFERRGYKVLTAASARQGLRNEAPHSLLPVITRICGENPPGFEETSTTA